MLKHALLGALALGVVGGQAWAAGPPPAVAYVVVPTGSGQTAQFVYSGVTSWIDQTNTSGASIGTPTAASQGSPLPVQIIGGGGGSGSSAVRANDTSTTSRDQTHDDTLANAQAGTGLKTADPNNASLGGSGTAPITATVGTSYAVGRSLQVNATVGGTITFVENGVAVPWIISPGTTEIAHATTQVSSAGSATATFIVHY